MTVPGKALSHLDSLPRSISASYQIHSTNRRAAADEEETEACSENDLGMGVKKATIAAIPHHMYGLGWKTEWLRLLGSLHSVKNSPGSYSIVYKQTES